MKTITKFLIALFLGLGELEAAQVDIGLTTGQASNGSTFLNGAAVRVGVFAGYTDVLGASFFTGKSYTDLSSAFTALPELNAAVEATSGFGQFYLSYDTGSNASGTSLHGYLTPLPLKPPPIGLLSAEEEILVAPRLQFLILTGLPLPRLQLT